MAERGDPSNAHAFTPVSADTFGNTSLLRALPCSATLALNPTGSGDAQSPTGTGKKTLSVAEYHHLLREADANMADGAHADLDEVDFDESDVEQTAAATRQSPKSLWASPLSSESERGEEERVALNPDALRQAGALSNRDSDAGEGESARSRSKRDRRSPKGVTDDVRMEVITNDLDEAQEQQLDEQRYLTRAESPVRATRKEERNLTEYFYRPLGTVRPQIPTPGPPARTQSEVAIRKDLRASKLSLKQWSLGRYSARLHQQRNGEPVHPIAEVPVVYEGSRDAQSLEDDFLYWCDKEHFPIRELMQSWHVDDVKNERKLRFLYAKLKALHKLNEPLVDLSPPNPDRPAVSQPSKRKTTAGPKAYATAPRQKRARGPSSPPGGSGPAPKSSVSAGSPATSQSTRASRAGGDASATSPRGSAFDLDGQVARPEAGRGRRVSVDSLDQDLDLLWSKHDRLADKVRDLVKDWRRDLEDAVKERDLKIAALERHLANLQGKVEALTALSGRALPQPELVARPLADQYSREYYYRPPAYDSYDRRYSAREDRSYDRSHDRSYERPRESYRDFRGYPDSHSHESERYCSSEGWAYHSSRSARDPAGPLAQPCAEPSARLDETEAKAPVGSQEAASSAPDRGTA